MVLLRHFQKQELEIKFLTYRQSELSSEKEIYSDVYVYCWRTAQLFVLYLRAWSFKHRVQFLLESERSVYLFYIFLNGNINRWNVNSGYASYCS